MNATPSEGAAGRDGWSETGAVGRRAGEPWPALKASDPIGLHLIGPLQTNKIRDALTVFDTIHTLDRPRLAEKLAAPFPEASEELYGIAANGKFYAFGGLGKAWTPKGLMYEYDPAGNKWTKKSNMPLALHHPAWAELNGKIYLFGGFVKPDKGPTAWVPINNSWEYDPANDTWRALAPMPSKRGAAAAADLDQAERLGERVFLNSGCRFQDQGGITLGDLSKAFEPLTGTFK